VFIQIKGKHYYLWRAVDQEGDVLDILVQPRRNANAAKRFFRKLLKGLGYSPHTVVTDKPRSYGAAHRELGLTAEHETGRYENNRAENSHEPTRQKERQMRGFKSPGHAQQLLSAHGPINDLFRHDRHRMSAASFRTLRHRAFDAWSRFTETMSAAQL
jgi:putative transposase